MPFGGNVRANPLEESSGVPQFAAIKNSFRYFNSSPEITRLAVMMYNGWLFSKPT
jgi:hypothetical protein